MYDWRDSSEMENAPEETTGKGHKTRKMKRSSITMVKGRFVRVCLARRKLLGRRKANLEAALWLQKYLAWQRPWFATAELGEAVRLAMMLRPTRHMLRHLVARNPRPHGGLADDVPLFGPVDTQSSHRRPCRIVQSDRLLHARRWEEVDGVSSGDGRRRQVARYMQSWLLRVACVV